MNNKFRNTFLIYAIPVIRIIIGMAFFLSGLFKLIDLKGFQKIIETMGLLGGPLPLMASIIIPVLELILGIMLVLGIYMRITALHLNVLVVVFSWVTFYVLRSRPDMLCGCFGGFFDMTFSIYHFIVLFIIFILNLIIVIEPNDTWNLQKLFRDKIPASKKMLIVEILIYILIAAGIILIGLALYLNFWGSKGRVEENSQDENTSVAVQDSSKTEVSISEADQGQEDIKEESTPEESSQSEIIYITVDEAYEAYLSDEDFIFVDVRSQSEYDSGHIKGALFIPVSEIQDRAVELPKDKPIVLYCNGSSCNRSGTAASILATQGFEKIYDLTGKGIDEWISKGYPSE
ncbi:MAG: DoxX family membrane protein [Actinobacteria bacterium]|nr:DoxX family membrane protein [Actinomycetota bacterium]